jgi:thiamine-phosphate pyrophosphorylase
MNISGLYTFADTTYCPHLTHVELACQLLEGGAKIIQLRAKNKTHSELLSIAGEIVSLKKIYDFIFIINDYPQVCVEVDADGVHVGQEDVPVSQTRAIVGPDKIVGLSTHSLEQASAAQSLPVDYIGLGGIFPTQTKPKGHPVLGVKILRQVVELSRVPVVVIGGINRTHVQDVVATGVQSWAIVSAINGAADIASETLFFSSLL